MTILFIFSVLPWALSAQQKYGKEVVPLAPDVWSFMKYGTESCPDLYTGTLHESISLYTYQDKDFTFPVSLNYSGNGFRPNMTTGMTGLGWTLCAGGCITREVRQLCDESASGNLNGCLKFSRSDYSSSLLDGGRTFLDIPGSGMVYYQPQSGSLKYETEPDIFSFNFMGHSGKFIIVRIPQGGFKCQVFEADASPGLYHIEPDDPSDGIISHFTITAGDGFSYRFTHDRDQDFSISSSYEDGVPSVSGDVYMSWMLTGITSPTGREMSLVYAVQTGLSCVRPSAFRGSSFQEDVDDGPGFLNGYASLSYALSDRRYLRFDTNTASLIRISVPDSGVEMVFHYSDRLRCEKLCRYGSSPEDLLYTKKLDSIVVSDVLRHRILRTIRFTYFYPSHGNPLLLLRSVHVDGLGSWSMDYYREDGVFPYQGTTSIDHWGFLNDVQPAYDFSDLIPEVNIGATFLDQTINTQTSRREPDFEPATTGMLRRLYYPTGGFSEYTYEQNTYSHSLRRDASSYGFLYLCDEQTDQVCGGLRIKTISAGPSTRSYDYSTDGRSSGILERYPYYYNYFSATHADSGYRCEQISLSSFSTFSYPLDAHDVTYSSVTERLGNGSRTKTDFTSFLDEDCQDQYPDGSTIRVFGGVDVGSDMMNDAFVYADSRHYLRGLVRRVRHYAAGSSIPWKEERRSYVDRSVSDHEVFTSAYAAVATTYPHRLFLSNILPAGTVSVQWEGTDSLLSSTSFSYNSLGQVTETRNIDYGLGSTYVDRVQYVADLSESSGLMREMLNQGMGSYPVKELSAFHLSPDPSDSRLRLKSGKSYAYEIVEGVPLMSGVSVLRLSPSNPGPFSGFEFDDDLVCNMVIHHDEDLLPVEEISRDGTHTTYLWGYDGLYPVAVLHNCSLSMYLSLAEDYVWGNCFLEGLPDELRSLLYEDNRFETTVYDYIPNVGVSSITDPAGRTTYYIYDAHGRLSQIVDDRGRPVKAYRYHSVTE
ncbi:MAG: RHS repeat protein [Bacteroidales bacterium]|nr:RHS repeat protein [Bacteroidales bacterium]